MNEALNEMSELVLRKREKAFQAERGKGQTRSLTEMGVFEDKQEALFGESKTAYRQV